MDILILLSNQDNITKNVSVWSYLYYGPKSYSGEREKNKVNKTLLPNTEEIIMLQNILEVLPEKEVKLKIKVLEEGRKTPQDFTKNLTISLKTEPEKNTQNPITGEVVYVSSDEKIKNYMPVLLVCIFLLVIVAMKLIKPI